MKGKRICSVLVSLILVLSLLPLPAAAADRGAIEYSVTLVPGQGEGYGAAFSSAFQGSIPTGRENAGNCEFYYEDDGTMGFKTDVGWYPSDWSSPIEGVGFAGWSDGEDVYHRLDGPSTRLTAVWGGEWYDIPYGACIVGPSTITLTHGGYTDAVWYSEQIELFDAGGIEIDLEAVAGEMVGPGPSIPFGITGGDHPADGTYSSSFYWYTWNVDPDEEHPLAIYVDPDAFNAARAEFPGTYTATITYKIVWLRDSAPYYPEGHSGEIQLILTVPSHGGDVNGDGKVNMTDVALLATCVKARGSGVDIVPISGDLNGDGKVNMTDVALLATFVKARGQGVVIY
jgi:hypothetical protein